MAMKKLKLENLAVESFDTMPAATADRGNGARGAVHLRHALQLPGMSHLRSVVLRHRVRLVLGQRVRHVSANLCRRHLRGAFRHLLHQLQPRRVLSGFAPRHP
jgi:hypothetical protein